MERQLRSMMFGSGAESESRVIGSLLGGVPVEDLVTAEEKQVRKH